MAVSHYFNNIRSFGEQNLIEDLIIETIKIHGIDMFYIPRTLVNKDSLFGEDPISRFTDAKMIEFYLENVNGFEGSNDLLSKFGLQVKDTAILVVSKKRFLKETGSFRPLEGDIVYFPLTKGFFEIKYVEHENPFFQLGKNYTFKLSVELFQYSAETFSTGETEIDTIAAGREFNLYLGISANSGAGSSFTAGNQVYQYSNGTLTGPVTGANATATVKEFSNNIVTLKNPIGNWMPSTSTVRYITSSDHLTYKKVLTSSDSLDNSAYNDNSDIQTTTDLSLDFTIQNPFGTP